MESTNQQKLSSFIYDLVGNKLPVYSVHDNYQNLIQSFSDCFNEKISKLREKFDTVDMPTCIVNLGPPVNSRYSHG